MTGLPVDFAQLSVMVVDDNRHMGALICSILRVLSIKKLKEVGDGEAALEEITAF
jgi:CheY-like chemotaxis protein